jgi:hypothetical protein
MQNREHIPQHKHASSMNLASDLYRHTSSLQHKHTLHNTLHCSLQRLLDSLEAWFEGWN